MGAICLATRPKHGSEGLSRKECGEKSPSGDGLKVSTATNKIVLLNFDAEGFVHADLQSGISLSARLLTGAEFSS
jgi:hypothetical protein